MYVSLAAEGEKERGDKIMGVEVFMGVSCHWNS